MARHLAAPAARRPFRIPADHPARTDLETWLPLFVVALGIATMIAFGF